MPANDATRNIIDEFNAHTALKIGYLYRVKESETASGDHIRELTFNDGRYEGENREGLAKLRRNFLTIEDVNTKLVLENTKFLGEIDTKDQVIADQTQTIADQTQTIGDLHRTITKLQKDNSNLKDESKASTGRYQAENNDLRSQLTQQSRELQSKNDRTTNQVAKIEQLNDQLKDVEAVQHTIAERERELIMMKTSYDDLLAAHQDLEKNLKRHQDNLVLTETSLSDRTAELETVQKELTQLQKDKSESPETNKTHKKRIPSRVCSEKYWNYIPVENGKLRLKGMITQTIFPSDLMHLIPRELCHRGTIHLDKLNNFEHRSAKADIIKEFENRKVT